MEDQEKEYQQDGWKVTLRSEIIKVLTGHSKEREQVYAEIGYYYQCCAPASLYKYYPDDQLHLKSVEYTGAVKPPVRRIGNHLSGHKETTVPDR